MISIEPSPVMASARSHNSSSREIATDFFASDLDLICCKMSLLNFMMHGMCGVIIHQDALMQDFRNAWVVNEDLYSGKLSGIKKINEDQVNQLYSQWKYISNIMNGVKNNVPDAPNEPEPVPEPEPVHDDIFKASDKNFVQLKLNL